MLAWHEVRLRNTSPRSAIFNRRFTGEIHAAGYFALRFAL
jgi:hypothetical protein